MGAQLSATVEPFLAYEDVSTDLSVRVRKELEAKGSQVGARRLGQLRKGSLLCFRVKFVMCFGLVLSVLSTTVVIHVNVNVLLLANLFPCAQQSTSSRPTLGTACPVLVEVTDHYGVFLASHAAARLLHSRRSSSSASS